MRLLRKFKDHPNISKLVDAYNANEELRVVMKYYAKGDLLDKINDLKSRRKWFSEQALLRILTDILTGLSYLHANNCIHRDLKPENIFIDNFNRCAIGDFGFSRVVENADHLAMSMVGSYFYIAPEIMRHIEYDSKVDMFSLGCILFLICTHTHAIPDANVLCIEHRGSMMPDVQFPDIYDSRIRDICKSLLEYNPSNRPTADEVLQHPLIRKYLNGCYDEVVK